MSSTLHVEKPSETISPYSDPEAQARLQLRGQNVDDVEETLPPSYLPCLDARPGGNRSWQSTEVPFKDAARLDAFCGRMGVSTRSVLQLAWALVLRCYVGNPSVCFACYFYEGASDAPDEGICKIDIEAETPLKAVLDKVDQQRGGIPPSSKKAQMFSTDNSRSSPSIPANTAFLFQYGNGRDWPDMDDSKSCGFGDDGSIDVSSSRATSKTLLPIAQQAQVVVKTNLSRGNFLATIDYLQPTLSVVSSLNVANAYAKAIREIMMYPARIVKDVDLLSMRDLEQLGMWNRDFPQKVDACVHDLVLRHAERSPLSLAVCAWDGNLTFSELDVLSSCLAKKLVNAGVRRETLVPVCFEKSLYAVVAMVAILRARGAFVPLDPSHPKDRLEAIISKAGAKVVVTSPTTANLFRNISVSVIEVSPSFIESPDGSVDVHLPTASPSDAAFVLFTSGSTGKPKGIIQEHASVCTSAIAHGNALNVTSESRV
ncbi:MAG: hypothetical protein Q9168_006589 [Polycauliona sp. 1 TL-2023]